MDLSSMSPFSSRPLSPRVWVTVEIDRFGEAPYIYTIIGKDKIIVIDTGCNTADIREHLRTLPGCETLPFLVVNTHIHYDHIMGNACFCRGVSAGASEPRDDCLGLCQGGRDPAFSKNWRETSLQSEVGALIKNFCVTRWLREGERLHLDDAEPDDADSLEVIYTPGHTPDSISLYLRREQRLFTGDLVYPGSLYLFLPGSSILEFEGSVGALRRRWPGGGGSPSPVLSCGHCSSDLEFEALEELAEAFDKARTGELAVKPTTSNYTKDALVEFATRTFSIMCRAADWPPPPR